MTKADILNEIRKFPVIERLRLVEAALDLIRSDLQKEAAAQPCQTGTGSQLAKAAKALLPDYAAGGELTIFTTLDSEEVDETR